MGCCGLKRITAEGTIASTSHLADASTDLSKAPLRTRRPRVRFLVLGLATLAVWAGVALLVDALDDAWTLSDWYATAQTVAVFALGLLLTRRQEQLQGKLADLELREKVTVVLAQCAEMRTNPVRQSLLLLGDARSALSLYPYAEPSLQREYVNAIEQGTRALATVSERVHAQGPEGLSPEVERLARTFREEFAVAVFGRRRGKVVPEIQRSARCVFEALDVAFPSSPGAESNDTRPPVER